VFVEGAVNVAAVNTRVLIVANPTRTTRRPLDTRRRLRLALVVPAFLGFVVAAVSATSRFVGLASWWLTTSPVTTDTTRTTVSAGTTGSTGTKFASPSVVSRFYCRKLTVAARAQHGTGDQSKSYEKWKRRYAHHHSSMEMLMETDISENTNNPSACRNCEHGATYFDGGCVWRR